MRRWCIATTEPCLVSCTLVLHFDALSSQRVEEPTWRMPCHSKLPVTLPINHGVLLIIKRFLIIFSIPPTYLAASTRRCYYWPLYGNNVVLTSCAYTDFLPSYVCCCSSVMSNRSWYIIEPVQRVSGSKRVKNGYSKSNLFSITLVKNTWRVSY